MPSSRGSNGTGGNGAVSNDAGRGVADFVSIFTVVVSVFVPQISNAFL